jgi:hypothetical protein
MKALSFINPWLWAITNLGKDLDNRRRKDGRMPHVCHHRGPLLLHASKGVGPRVHHDAHGANHADDAWSESYYDWAYHWMAERGLCWTRDMDRGRRTLPAVSALDRGGIAARAVVVGHVTPEQKVWADAAQTQPVLKGEPNFPDLRWHMEGSYGLVLRKVEELLFVPWKGALGLFEVPESVVLESAR